MGLIDGTPKGAPRSLVLAAFTLICFALPFFLAPPNGALAQTPEPAVKTIDAAGYAPFSGGNAAIVRDAAIEDALRKAVEQAVGTLVSAETMVENFQVLNDNVYTKTQGYIKGYSVLNENQSQGLYQVTVRATVAIGGLKNDLDALGVLYARAEKPKVLFLIAEQNIGHRHYVFWWWGRSEYMGETVDMSAAETALKESFLGRGFNVVEGAGRLDGIEISNAYRVADLTNDGARQIARKFNAEIVVKGKALAKEGPRTPGSQVGSYIADITVEAIKVDNGAVLASARGHGTSRHVSDVTGGVEAISRASNEAADRLVEQIAAKWQSGNMVTLRLGGIKDFKKIADFKNALKTRVKGVKAVYQRGFEGDQAVFELDTRASTQNIADDLSRLSSFPLKITNMTQSTIDAVMEER
ncbi:MAG: hypothetical protein HZB22_06120 [Deltaproteobacteria bacterium]|nr:hypothetical protein [Deltaproteobacteria bacterium]